MQRFVPALAACFALVLALAAAPALAQAPATVFIEELTSTELAALVRAGKTTVIVPVGGTEQNGPHLVLGKHNVRVKALAEKVALALGNALVAPVIAYVPEGNVSPPTGHMRYPGTITVPNDVYRKVLESAARSFRQHGFRDIVFLGDHGDYQKDNERVARDLDREWAASPVRVHAIGEYYRASTAGFAATLKGSGHAAAEIGLHAGLADTSLALAVDPRLVRSDVLKSVPPGPQGLPGVTGDPRHASAELGRPAVDAIVKATVAAIETAVAAR